MSFACACFSPLCTYIPSACQSYVLVCHLYVTCMYLYVMVCVSFVLVFHPYVTRLYSYVISMSLVCTRMSSVCHSSVVLPWTILIIGFHQLISKCRKWINFFVKTRNENYKSLRDIDKEISIEGASLKFGVPRNTISNWVNKFF